MSELNENLSESELRKKAYSIAMRLKNSGLDLEAIYARLEKQGIPEDIAKQVVYDTQVQQKKDIQREAEPRYNFALLRIGIGLALAFISWLIFPDHIILPIGLIAGGIIAALIAKNKMEN